MNYLKMFFVSLPASNSAMGTLNANDWTKVIRLLLVAFIGAFAVKVGGSTLNDGNLNAVLLDAGQAGVMAVVAAGVEIARRLVSTKPADPSVLPSNPA